MLLSWWDFFFIYIYIYILLTLYSPWLCFSYSEHRTLLEDLAQLGFRATFSKLCWSDSDLWWTGAFSLLLPLWKSLIQRLSSKELCNGRRWLKMLAQTLQPAGSPMWSLFAQIGPHLGLDLCSVPKTYFSRSPHHLCFWPCHAGGIWRNILTFPACVHLPALISLLSVLQWEKKWMCLLWTLAFFFNRSPPGGEKIPAPFLLGLCPTSLFTTKHPGETVNRNWERVVLISHAQTCHSTLVQICLFVCPYNEEKASLKKKWWWKIVEVRIFHLAMFKCLG